MDLGTFLAHFLYIAVAFGGGYAIGRLDLEKVLKFFRIKK
jgi:hypothetical protein